MLLKIRLLLLAEMLLRNRRLPVRGSRACGQTLTQKSRTAWEAILTIEGHCFVAKTVVSAAAAGAVQILDLVQSLDYMLVVKAAVRILPGSTRLAVVAAVAAAVDRNHPDSIPRRRCSILLVVAGQNQTLAGSILRLGSAEAGPDLDPDPEVGRIPSPLD